MTRLKGEMGMTRGRRQEEDRGSYSLIKAQMMRNLHDKGNESGKLNQYSPIFILLSPEHKEDHTSHLLGLKQMAEVSL